MASENNVLSNATVRHTLTHLFIIALGALMIYPVVWLIVSSFKPNNMIFSDPGLIPKTITIENYISGWNGYAGTTFGRFFANSLFMSGVAIVGNLISCTMATYAFARLQFAGRRFWFAIMMLTLMLPGHVTLATGAWADVHGIVDNQFYDRERGDYSFSSDASWIAAEPLWITAERQGIKAATFFWVGSETDWHERRATYRVVPFDGTLGEAPKVDQIVMSPPRAVRTRDRLMMVPSPVATRISPPLMVSTPFSAPVALDDSALTCSLPPGATMSTSPPR